MSDLYEAGSWLDWRGRRNGYGDGSRWLINKDASGNGWLLHEPITPTSLGALWFESYDVARKAFIAFSGYDALHPRAGGWGDTTLTIPDG